MPCINRPFFRTFALGLGELGIGRRKLPDDAGHPPTAFSMKPKHASRIPHITTSLMREVCPKWSQVTVRSALTVELSWLAGWLAGYVIPYQVVSKKDDILDYCFLVSPYVIFFWHHLLT